jgi:thiamine pyrophosphate-dependent acetolactate synthase large subunit-like protein
MKLGDFLIAYLEKIGVSHMFGIPGDLVINLFFKFGRHRGLKIVTFSHEPASALPPMATLGRKVGSV